MRKVAKLLNWKHSIFLASFALFACGDDDDDNPVSGTSGSSSVNVPSVYEFESRFTAGQSSVVYTGQTVRNLLLQDLKIFTDALGKDGAQPATAEDMLMFYAHDDSYNMTTLTKPKDGSAALESKYSSISTGKNLNGKIYGETLIEYPGKTADDKVREWIQIIADNSQDPNKLGTPAVYTTDDGLDLSQMINKVLIGTVPYYQATGKYLTLLFEKGNSEAKEGKTYTDMEHYWDEAFGYFGAAQDYNTYSDADIKSKGSKDSNGDGQIDFNKEYNFSLAVGAAKRDIGSSTGVDLTKEIFDAFLTGRALITAEGDQADIEVHQITAANGMEKVIAATVVHYINDTLADMAQIGTSNYSQKDHNKHWAEMKGYAIGLQTSSFKLISDSQLRELAGTMGTAPVYAEPGSSAYNTAVANLNRARDVLQEAYGFAAADVENW